MPTRLLEAKVPDEKPPTGGSVLRRYALVIGSNDDGGAGREKLKFAARDASTVADTAALDRLRQRARDGERALLGHRYRRRALKRMSPASRS